MKPITKVMTAFTLGILLQGGIYYYLDQYMFAPTTDFSVAGESQKADDKFPDIKEGNKYFSYDRKYMAVVTEKSIRIYTSGKDTPAEIDLKGRSVSYFDWMPDRNLAIMGLYGGPKDQVIMARLNADDPDHEVDTELEDVPEGSKIVDVAYSEATNVVYMKVKVAESTYRIYRTDANYDTRRVYMQASNIGRIAVFYDEDKFFYDNVRTGDVFMFDGTEGGWRVINPSGRYRLIGVDNKQNIYIARVDEDDNALAVYEGKLGVGFKPVYKYNNPITLSEVTMDEVKDIMANGSDTATKITDEREDTAGKSKSDSKSNSKSDSKSNSDSKSDSDKKTR